MTISKHYAQERQKREELIKSIGYGNIIKSVIKENYRGETIHEISDTGIITIYSRFTHVLITRLIAEPYQIKRYYTDSEKPPKALLDIAFIHAQVGYSYY